MSAAMSARGESPARRQGEQHCPSPKYTRLNEKEDLVNLNNRLACYIDRVRTLEAENSRLSHEVRSSQEGVSREVASVKSLYEGELADARRLLDELSREKAKIQIDTQRLFAENQELTASLQKKVEEVADQQGELLLIENALSELTNKYNLLQADTKKATDKNRSLQEDVKKLSDELRGTRKELEIEILKRVDAENSLQTLKEEFAFSEHLLKQQLLETQNKVEVERSEIDGILNQQYEERLCQSLQEIRDQYEADLEENKNEVKKMYEEKLKSLENQLQRSNNITKMAMEELQSVRAKLENLNGVVKELEDERNSALNNMREAEKKLDNVKAQYLNDYKIHEAEMKKMREQIAKQIKDYEELMDVKVTLDMEISAFRKLLECEEARLNITPPADNSSRRILKGKRRHEEMESSYFLNSSTSSPKAVVKVSHDGKYIKICNQTNNTIAIGSWKLIQKVDGQSVTYSFARNTKIKGGSALTVWSADEQNIPRGSDNIQMKDQKWIVADSMVIALQNEKNEEVAIADRQQVKQPTPSHKLRVVGHTDRPSSANSSFTEDKCSIM